MSRAQQDLAHVRSSTREPCVSRGSACVGCQVFQLGMGSREGFGMACGYVVRCRGEGRTPAANA